MREQANFSELQINVHELLKDLEYVEREMTSVRKDLKYVINLLEALNREYDKIKEEVSCLL